MRAWVNRVERIGNLNYPEQARQRRLQGRLVLTVSVRRDGSVQAIEVVESSGIALLDQSALRIVRLAEPFPTLPETRRTEERRVGQGCVSTCRSGCSQYHKKKNKKHER